MVLPKESVVHGSQASHPSCATPQTDVQPHELPGLDRLLHLVLNNAAMIALPGGLGPLSEVALAWSLLQTGEIAARPFVLLGPLWRETIRVYAQAEYVRPRDMDLLYLATSSETAVAYVKQSLAARGG